MLDKGNQYPLPCFFYSVGVAPITARSSLTARDIAQHLRRGDEPLSAAVDRFRNWTKMGLIKPVGELHPGTGRKKRYSPAALLEAVLLQSVLDLTSRPAAELAGVVRGILVVMEHGGKFSFDSGDTRYTCELVDGRRVRISTARNPHSHVVINLKPLFASYRLNVEDFPQLAHLVKNLNS
jgi:hypothetical protein